MRQCKWMVMFALLAVGCANTQPDESLETQQALETAPISDPSEDRAEANAFERAEKQAWNEKHSDPTPGAITPEVVDWEEARATRQLSDALLPAEQAAKLPEIKLPVLSFDDAKLLAGARLSHFGNWYVLAVESDDGLNMNIRGNRNAVDATNMQIPEAARKAAENYTLTRTHQVVTVSWRSFGVSYSLDIECSKPMDDTRCTQDAFALEMAEQLGVIGGAP